MILLRAKMKSLLSALLCERRLLKMFEEGKVFLLLAILAIIWSEIEKYPDTEETF